MEKTLTGKKLQCCKDSLWQSTTFESLDEALEIETNPQVELGGIEILALNISYRKNRDITIYHAFTKGCGLTVLLGCFNLFHWFGFATTRLLYSVIQLITNLLATQEFLDKVKP